MFGVTTSFLQCRRSISARRGQVSGARAACIGQFAAGVVEFIAQPARFGASFLRSFITLDRGPLGTFECPFTVCGPLHSQVTFGGNSTDLLRCGTLCLLDVGIGNALDPLFLLSCVSSKAFQFVSGFLPHGTDLVLSCTASSEHIIGRFFGDSANFPERIISGGERSGDAFLSCFGRSCGIFCSRVGLVAVLLSSASSGVGSSGGGFGFGDPPGRFGFRCLHLHFGHRGVGERRHFRDSRIERGAQLIGQATELNE